jgi:phage terminase Nu1 subunit (DNA packaging protein)
MSDERAVDEGVLIASAAVAMAVKNAIIVRALRDDQPYVPAEVVDMVRTELLDLANQNQANSERLEDLAEEVLQPGEMDVGSENYNEPDSPKLSERSAIHERVREQLVGLSTDDDYLERVAETARTAAWDDVGGAIESRLLRVPSASDRQYAEKRDDRIRSLLKVDLRALETQVRKQQRRARRVG